MALDFQLVDVKFTQGLDTQTQKKLVVPGKWNLLNNCTLSETGTPQKRAGVKALVASATGNGLATFNNELLVVKGSSVSSIVSPNGNPSTYPASALAVTGQVGFVDVTKTQIRAASGYQEGMDCAYGLGFTAYVWNDFTAAGAFNGTFLTIIDESTGAHAMQPVQMNAGANQPRVVFSVDAFFAFYRVGTTLRCLVIRVTAGALTYGAETTLISSVNVTTQNFDACEFGQTSTVGSIAVSYCWGDGVTSVRSILVTQAAGIPAIAAGPVNLFTQIEMQVNGIMGLGVCWMSASATGSFATFAFGTLGTLAGTSVRVLDNLFASAAVAALVDATVPAVASPCHVVAVGEAGFNVACCFTDQQSSAGAAASVQPIRRTEILLAAGVVSVISNTTLINSVVGVGGAAVVAPPQGPFICGKPISLDGWDSTGAGGLVSGRLFLPLCTVSYYAATVTSTLNQQNSFFLLDATSGAVVSKALYGNYGIPAQFTFAPLVYTASSIALIEFDGPIVGLGLSRSARYVLACTERGKLAFNSGINITQTGLVRLAFEPRLAQPPIRTQLGPATYFAGGSLSMYDGQGVTEMGFPLFPEGIAAVVSAGGAMTAGVHQVVAVYEWVDGQGQRHQSAPSLPVSFTITAGQQTVTVTTPTLMLSQKTGISVVLYMTQAAGVTFSRVTSLAAPVLNTTAAATVNQVFALIDGDFASNELLYTQPLQGGTTLPSDAPGPCSVLAVHQNRLFVDLTDRQGAFRYSQILGRNVGLRWNETLGGTVPVDGGPIVGFVDMDEKLIIFCARKIYFVAGTGPLPSGGFSNYSEPVEIMSDVGCSEPRSILKLPNGVAFKSLKGFQMLGRDLVVRYIGGPVFAYDDYAVMSATMLEDQQEARFTCAFSFHLGQGGVELGLTLVYSYVLDQWSTSIVNVAPATGSPHQLVGYDSAWWPAQRRFVSASLVDGVSIDQPGVYSDSPGAGAATAVIMSARTSFLHLPGMEGFQRVRWLYLTASYPSGASSLIGVTITVDFDDVYSAVTPPGATGAYSTTGTQLAATYGTGLTIDFRHKLHRQKCKSVAFTFTDTSAFSGFLGINGFEALALEVGMKRGTNKLSASQTVA